MLNEFEKKALIPDRPDRAPEEKPRGDGVEPLLQVLRRRLARDLHDQVGWHLVALSYGLRDLQANPGSVEEMRKLRGRLDEFGSALRELTSSFRDSVPARQPLVRLVSDFCADWTQITAIPVSLRFETSAVDAPADIAATVLAILREALTNTARHGAGATCVAVGVDRLAHGGIRLLIDDSRDGAKAVPDLAPLVEGQGITGMRRRAEEAGGTFSVARSPAGGVAIHVELSWGEER